jgi:hypothetical protein
VKPPYPMTSPTAHTHEPTFSTSAPSSAGKANAILPTDSAVGEKTRPPIAGDAVDLFRPRLPAGLAPETRAAGQA